ncbi:MBL fold metallo-hydrolase [Alysiella filiformis]|uniref:L-ascorbate metabolism protein UlaG, beta-lactamase superfamily n=1 Tax=Alysiella filiformis DSM 16848 TaxID=1120981 RepID=A0A286EL62_9NEIS|nr:MBL fold metallo-hydrolase [Alysiella filiformis]QMT30981.1 MBL fold metallo-hydrolase [Alysiella filiformis]UBQ56032.1 MBL fold metallo-hydrolase [Alysiella filiformis DSM 16848]SOD71673.1 L-ascorbate metabolism protein UlaG, beta-lactamase superfamily [Alysiella filiformis DSM 16848]
MKFPFLRKKRFILLLLVLLLLAIGAWQTHTTFPPYPASNHHNPQTGQFFNTPPTRPVKSGTAGAMWQMMINEKAQHPPTRLPMQDIDWQNFLAPSERVKFIWFGHSTLLLRVQDQTVMFDPVYAQTVSPVGLMMHRFQAPPAALHELPPLDWVVYTHAHYDHLDKDVVQYFIKNQPNIQYLVPLGLGAYLRDWGVADSQIHELDWWQTLDLHGATFHVLPARHDAARTPFDAKKSLWASWALTTPTEKIYFSGDSSYAPHFAEIGARFGGFDLAFVENGQYNELWEDNHMFPTQTVQAAADLKAQRWMPIHWGAYPLSTHDWDASVRESSSLAAQRNLPMLTPIMGQIFDAQTASEKWWEKVK